MKNKLKKVFAAGLGLAMIFSQCGCKAGTPGQTSASNAPDAVQTDIPDLCKTVASKDGLGEDAIVGTCYGDDEISDAKLMQIVTKHFNAVTLENELKPETMSESDREYYKTVTEGVSKRMSEINLPQTTP